MQIRRSLTATTAMLLVGVAAPSMAAAQLGVQQERNAPSTYAITNARIVPGTGATIERGTVVIRDGVITAVGASAAVPSDARTVDGTGLTVYPGFIEAFGSLGMPSRSNGNGGRGGRPGGGPQAFFRGQQQEQPDGAPNSLHPPGQQPEILAVDLLDPADDAFTAAQAAGFTAALTAPASGIFVGQSAVISLRDGAVQELVLRSPVAMHIGFTTSRGFGGGFPNSLLGVFAALRQMLLDAQHYAAVQAAYTANPRGRARPELDPSLAALQPALARQMPVVMTANSEREIARALDLAKEFNLRAVIAGGQEAYKIADRLKAENVPVLLSMDFPERPARRGPDAEPEPLRVLRERVEAPRTPARLVDAGVQVALQSGGGYDDFLANLQRAVENGLSRQAALRALTVAPAELFGLGDRLGTVEAGKIANLTLVRGDVFEPGATVTQLFVDGRPVTVRAAAGRGEGTTATAAGTWTVTVTLEGSDHPVTLGLQQSGETLRGTLQGTLGTAQISNGSLTPEGELRFTSTVTLPAGSEEATFVGTLTGNTIRGTVTIVGHDPGTFVGTRPEARGPGGARGQGRGAGRPPQR
ncbi:MAG TPA: amidohydrolase family protein [Gemmatimonadaceae bacterium]|nr:amidohydrolase family protein [Gemmatimonadaceae bacterium]